jgi:Xaa-Pro aminopeptidase
MCEHRIEAVQQTESEFMIELKEYRSRRNDVLKALKGAIGVVFAGEDTAGLEEKWRAHSHFFYLTGIADEPGAILLLDPNHPSEDRRAILFLRPLNPELEKWDGFRAEISTALKDRYGFKVISRTNYLSRFLSESARRSKRFACLHPLAAHTATVSPDLELFRKLAERIPGSSVEDRSELIAQMRASKSSGEVALIQRAMDVTARGYYAVLKNLRPGMSEFDVQTLLEHAYKQGGARGTLYGTIVGGGFNATVLHYRANDQPLNDGDLVCIDSAASMGGYSADITRTLPVSGRFTKRQREIYDIVLRAEEAAIKAVKPGASFWDIDKVARGIIEKAGFGAYFIHGIGHHLGIEVHDITPIENEGRLRLGAVITIEPGIYLPDETIGVRIEDDVLVTKNGSKNLSAMIPKKAEEIEKLMKR